MLRRPICSLLLAVFLLVPGTPALAGTGAPAVALQGTVSHDGNLQDSGVQTPLRIRWMHRFRGVTGYALIADGLVFVPESVAEPGNDLLRIHALDAVDGHEVWRRRIHQQYGWVGIAYDAGRLFVVTQTAFVRAFDGTTGVQVWGMQLPGQAFSDAPPTADSGVLYASGSSAGGTLYAIDEVDGSVLWSSSVQNGDISSPALSADDVFVSYACPQAYSFARSDGSPNWHYSGVCQGGGGKTAAYYGGRLYVRDVLLASKNGLVLDAVTGDVLNDFNSELIPAFTGTTGFFTQSGDVVARDLDTWERLWRFSGDGLLRTAPLVVGDVVFVGSKSGMLYGVDVATGARRVSIDLVTGIRRPDEQNIRRPVSGLSAGEGILVVPATHRLYGLD